MNTRQVSRRECHTAFSTPSCDALAKIDFAVRNATRTDLTVLKCDAKQILR